MEWNYHVMSPKRYGEPKAILFQTLTLPVLTDVSGFSQTREFVAVKGIKVEYQGIYTD